MLAEPELGSTENSYAIIAKLATGGMAEIYLARTESGAGVERYVVLKRILRHRATDIKFVNMFLDEARLAAQLQHPNIAQVYDTGKLGDSYFFTMEYVHGETVRELLYRAYSEGQLIPMACALTIIAGAAAGLQHAHERIGVDGKPLNIVHRDVSPSNLMISYDGHVKLVDFGVAKADHQSVETQSGTVKGKIGYMAPEQCRGGVVDARCDLFSLGIVMWELLTGDRLFKRATDFETMEAIVRTEVVPPSSFRPEIPPDIDAITMKLLAKDPADRYQNAEELHEAIEVAAARAGLTVSNAALRRFVRELFGPRPEPWLELKERVAAPEVVTVTGQPLFDPLLDDHLGKIVDLSPPAPGELPARRTLPRPATAPTVSGVATSQLRRSAELAKQARPISGSLARPGSGELARPVSGARPGSDTDDLIERPNRARRWTLAIAGVVGIAAIAAIVYLTSRSSNETLAMTTPPAPPARPPAVDAATATPATPDVATHGSEPDAAEPTTADIVLAQFARAEYATVVATCQADASALAAHVALCVQAACKERDEQLAQRWFEKVPGHHATVELCQAEGIALEPKKPRPGKPVRPPKPPPVKPPKPNCADDPMACR